MSDPQKSTSRPVDDPHRVVRQVAGTLACVVTTRPTAYLDHTAMCGCGWRGTGWLDLDPALREARVHFCEQGRQCIGSVTVNVVGTHPRSSFQRPCRKRAQDGHRTCHLHREFEDA